MTLKIGKILVLKSVLTRNIPVNKLLKLIALLLNIYIMCVMFFFFLGGGGVNDTLETIG